jgi:hypothetical protein
MTKEEYYKILFDLGILDDEEDWELYQEQELRYDIDPELFNKYRLESELNI